MAMVFMINLSFNEIFGIEYRIPIRAIVDAAKIPNVLLIKTGIDNPIKFIPTTKINACLFGTFPEGIGRLNFLFIRSRSASIRSLSTYIPVIISNVEIGSRTVFKIKNIPSRESEKLLRIRFEPIGTQKIPVAVASANSKPHFILELNRISCDLSITLILLPEAAAL
jgi:hypothetical protein